MIANFVYVLSTYLLMVNLRWPQRQCCVCIKYLFVVNLMWLQMPRMWVYQTPTQKWLQCFRNVQRLHGNVEFKLSKATCIYYALMELL